MLQVEASKSTFICQHKHVRETYQIVVSLGLIFNPNPVLHFSTYYIEPQKYGALWSSHIRFCLIIVVLYTSRLVPQGTCYFPLVPSNSICPSKA
uniref:Putative ovule protein n=1 Tax=Solanum chacoense TaxID=4108 RepID=A0A0V0HH15_SOLCH